MFSVLLKRTLYQQINSEIIFNYMW